MDKLLEDTEACDNNLGDDENSDDEDAIISFGKERLTTARRARLARLSSNCTTSSRFLHLLLSRGHGVGPDSPLEGKCSSRTRQESVM